MMTDDTLKREVTTREWRNEVEDHPLMCMFMLMTPLLLHSCCRCLSCHAGGCVKPYNLTISSITRLLGKNFLSLNRDPTMEVAFDLNSASGSISSRSGCAEFNIIALMVRAQ